MTWRKYGQMQGQIEGGEFIAVRRKNGEVDLIRLLNEEGGVRVDIENIVTIGFGDNVVETKNENGVIISNF